MTTDRRTVSFARDVRPLFRELDRDEMEYLFDLWSYDDVRNEAANVLERLEDRTMPCDMAWPDDQLELFRRWIDDGCQP